MCNFPSDVQRFGLGSEIRMRSEVRRCSEESGHLWQNSLFGYSYLVLIYFGCVRTRWDLFGCVRMYPNAFGGAWTSLDGHTGVQMDGSTDGRTGRQTDAGRGKGVCDLNDLQPPQKSAVNLKMKLK